MHITRQRLRFALPMAALLVIGACAGNGDSTVNGPTSIPDINGYPPLPNDAAPGASARAIATAAAIGRGVNFGNMLDAPTEGAWGLTVTSDFIDKASAAGFTSVRVPVRWSNHASANAPFTIDGAFMNRVDSGWYSSSIMSRMADSTATRGTCSRPGRWASYARQTPIVSS
jgi:endoglucanase